MTVPQTNDNVYQDILRSNSLQNSKRRHKPPSTTTLRGPELILPERRSSGRNASRPLTCINRCKKSKGGLPKYSTKDIVADQELHTNLRGMDSQDLVMFDISAQRRKGITTEDRRLARLKTRHAKYPPMEMFTHWILESTFFPKLIVVLIFLDCVTQVIQAEIFDKMELHFQILKIILDMMDWGILGIFFLEILLKWIDNFWQFWKSSWNVFDLCVTVLSFIPEIIKATINTQMAHLKLMEFFRKFRILRCLKMVSTFRPLRIVVLALFRSFKAVAIICLLLLVFAFIFALAGITLFENYNRSTIGGLVFSESFRDLYTAFITLFMLLTMNHWRALLSEVQRVQELDSITCSIYIILWIFIGSFIFLNIFIGILANTFSSVRSELSKVVQQIEMQQKADSFKAEMMNRLPTTFEEDEESIQEAPLDMNKKEILDWESYVEENMQAMQLQMEDEKVLWPKELLLRYFVLMNRLQDILDIRMRLQNLLAQLLLNLQDSSYTKESFQSFSS